MGLLPVYYLLSFFATISLWVCSQEVRRVVVIVQVYNTLLL